jgi:hypothetical protein
LAITPPPTHPHPLSLPPFFPAGLPPFPEYTPGTANWFGVVEFKFRALDRQGGSSIGTVRIVVGAFGGLGGGWERGRARVGGGMEPGVGLSRPFARDAAPPGQLTLGRARSRS